MAIAAIEHLTKVYGRPGTSICVHALRDLTLEFAGGESVAVCGPSGSGKSTLMNLLGCLDRPTSGRYLLGGTDVARLDDDELSAIRGRFVGFVFQNFNLVPQLTVLQNVEVPLFYQGVPAVARRHRARELVEMVGLSDRAHHRPVELSGGQQQRVAIARAVANDPLLILADEPTGNLDSTTAGAILDLFESLHDRGKTIVMVTHEEYVAARCHRRIVLMDGRVVTDERMPAGVDPSSAGARNNAALL